MCSRGTLFQQAQEAFDSLIEPCETLLNAVDLDDHVELYMDLDRQLEKLLPVMNKMRVRVAESDEHKRTYGPVMREKIKVLLTQFDEMYSVFQDELQPNFEYRVRKRRAQCAMLKESEELEKKKIQLRLEELQQKKSEKEEEQRQELIEQRRLQHEHESMKIDEAIKRLQANDKEAGDLREALLKRAGASAEMLRRDGFHLHAHHGVQLYEAHALQRSSMRSAIEPLYTILNNIVQHPDVPYHRVIRYLNPVFYSTVGCIPGSTEILMAAGFTLAKFSEEQALITQARETFERDSRTSVPQATIHPGEMYWVLREPDPLKYFESWTVSVERLTWVTNYLKSVMEKSRNLPFTRSIVVAES